MKLQQHNFRVTSKNWEVDEKDDELLVSPSGDIWEVRDGDNKGEQLFTWDAAMRETKKAGLRVPTDAEWDELVKTKDDIPNLVFAGYRDINGDFYSHSSYLYFWSSIKSGTIARSRRLFSGDSTVYRSTYSKANGFSVRCLEPEKKIKSSTPTLIRSAQYRNDDATFEEDKIIFEKVGDNGHFTPDSLHEFCKKARRALVAHKKLFNSKK